MAFRFLPNAHSIRRLRSEPLVVLSATLTLAICIGANTTVFSIANSILFRPLPYPNPDRIDWISERSGPGQQDIGAAPDYYLIRKNNRVFEEVAAYIPATVNWTGVERPQQLDAAVVSSSFFHLMGVQPMMGRYLAREEEGIKAAPVIVLSYVFWRNYLGGDAHILGKTVALDREPRTIVGVMPQGFDFPRGAQMWMPLAINEASELPISPNQPILVVSLLARRKPLVTVGEGAADLNRLSQIVRAEYKVFPTKFRWDVTIAATPLQERLTGQIRPTLLALAGAAGLVLLIACVNLANLLLARAGSRSREVAVRLALGANRGHIIRGLLAESLMLAAPGGIAGIAISWLAVQLLNAFKPAILVNYPPISIDWLTLAFTLGLTLTASVLFGLAPAVSAAGIGVYEALKSNGATHSGGAGAAKLRRLLLVAELGISLVLLIGAGLLARTLLKLAHTELGFRSDRLLTFRVNPIGPFDRDYAKFYLAVLDRLRQLPMAQSAAVLSDIPLSDEDFYMSGRIRVLGRPMTPFLERPIINNTVVSPEFFHVLGVPLKGGRAFDDRDSRPAASVTNYGMASSASVVVNEAFVRKLFPGENPVGQRLIFGPDRNSLTWTVIGVVGNIRGGALGADPPAMVYRCLCDGSRVTRAAFVVRTIGDPRSAIRSVEEQVHAVDHDLPVFDVKTMDQRRAAALAPERFQLAVIGGFAGIALVLAAVGVYGVVSYLVARRTKEIGIRMAMGARTADVLNMIVGETMLMVLMAIAVGLGGAWAFTRYIRSMLYGVTELDLFTFCAAPVAMLLIVLIACLAPARQAVRIDPMRALREE